MLMKTSQREVRDRDLAFPSAWRMFALGIPFWLVIISASMLSHMLRGHEYKIQYLPVDAFIIVLGAAVGAGVYSFLRSITHWEFSRQIMAALLLIVLIVLPVEAALRLAKFVNPFGEPHTLAELFDVRALVRGMIFWLAIFSLWGAACLALLHDREARQRERRVSALQLEAHDAQVRALRYQVNPHFLYNTLSSISTLILEGRTEIAERMTMCLSAFFRASLAQDPFQDVPLADELELQRLYLEIEQMRFSDSLRVEYDVPQGLENALVPSLILQPLIENSIKHGLQEAGKLTVLSISARGVNDRLVLEVADNGRGPGDGHGTGVGLGNVRRRLATRFGTACRFAANAPSEGGFQVRLEMPLQFAS
jgi:two-component system, LytTR family, sensor kinase